MKRYKSNKATKEMLADPNWLKGQEEIQNMYLNDIIQYCEDFSEKIDVDLYAQ